MNKNGVRALALLSLILCLASPSMAAKPVVGVADFTNTTNAYWWASSVGRELASALTNEMVSTGKFKMVERTKLDPVLDEQNLAQAGRIKAGTGARIGKLTGAQYLVMGTVTAYEENTQGTGGGITFKGISLGGKKDNAYIAIDLRVVNSTSGEIEYARTVEARSGGFGFSLGLFRSGFGGNLDQYKKTPAGKAIRAVMVEIIGYLECEMVDKNSSCRSDYEAKEKKRKKSLKSLIKLD